ncbi:unnamed protein product [Cylindrotheca closterium]|uniref:Uncharacterized protein n=1 Tax=Cylindrotheca closterium TaxID=2856 RepID=A0AAD2FNB8_9STRA|nr:unnamed protein product [Cylindrotheca closterium]
MTTLTNIDNEHLINHEFPKSSMDMQFANSWNYTEVFLNEIVSSVIENLDDVRCDSDVFCPSRHSFRRQDNQDTFEILDDLKKSESRQESPASPESEKNKISELYSLGSINSILDDSCDELDEVKLSLSEFEDFEEETAQSHESSKIEAVEGSDVYQEEKVLSDDEESDDGISPFVQSLTAISEEATADFSESSVVELSTATKAQQDQLEDTLEDILRVNAEIRYSDVVSLIDDSFLPRKSVAKAAHGVNSAYFDENIFEQQIGKENNRCAFLSPFLC